jgi:hypothetical protein
MADHTSAWPDPLMFEACSRPTHGSVATVAGQSRRNMSRRFADGDSLIVAFGAGSRSHTVMGKERRRPICRPVTTVAVDRGRQVVRRLKGRHDSTTG